jgi:uncharacterized membrane-anchored protein YhcB (DUF1043 family)
MDSVTNLTSRKWFLPAVAAIAGIVVGILYAWVISPVQWVDGEPHQLRTDLQEDYLRMAIDSYSVNRDADLAAERYAALGESGKEVLDAVGADPQEVSPTAIQGFRALIEIEQEVGEEPIVDGTEVAPEEEPEGPLASASGIILPVCGGTLVLGLILAAVLVIRSRSQEENENQDVASRLESSEFSFDPRPEIEDEAPAPAPPPPTADVVADDSLATFRTIYALGDDDYDDSFSIESPTGDFLGECGVGIGELIGVGEPNKVAAFEVWLFDKNDIQTVTKVMMSQYAFQDEETRNRLAAKGDPVAAELGGVISLQTASLEVEARIVDLTYGESALPSESFFERLTIELRAWSREGALT